MGKFERRKAIFLTGPVAISSAGEDPQAELKLSMPCHAAPAAPALARSAERPRTLAAAIKQLMKNENLCGMTAVKEASRRWPHLAQIWSAEVLKTASY